MKERPDVQNGAGVGGATVRVGAGVTLIGSATVFVTSHWPLPDTAVRLTELLVVGQEGSGVQITVNACVALVTASKHNNTDSGHKHTLSYTAEYTLMSDITYEGAHKCWTSDATHHTSQGLAGNCLAALQVVLSFINHESVCGI